MKKSKLKDLNSEGRTINASELTLVVGGQMAGGGGGTPETYTRMVTYDDIRGRCIPDAIPDMRA